MRLRKGRMTLGEPAKKATDSGPDSSLIFKSREEILSRASSQEMGVKAASPRSPVRKSGV